MQEKFLMKNVSKKIRKKTHVHLRALNGLIYKALTDLLCTFEVNCEIYDLNTGLSNNTQYAEYIGR